MVNGNTSCGNGQSDGFDERNDILGEIAPLGTALALTSPGQRSALSS